MEGRRVPSRVSEAQWGILMEFLESHPNLARARGYNNSARGRAEALRLWQEVANLLNAEGSGTTKSAKEWSVYISNYKSKLKKIVADINTDAHATGGGPPRAINLTDTDTRFLALLGPGFGQTAPQVRVQPFPDEQPSTSSAAESMVFVVEAVAQSQDGVVVAEEPIGVPLQETEDAPARVPSSTQLYSPARVPAQTPPPMDNQPHLPRRSRQRQRTRPLAPLDEARRVLSQVEQQRAAADAAHARALELLAQHLEPVAEFVRLWGRFVGIAESLFQISQKDILMPLPLLRERELNFMEDHDVNRMTECYNYPPSTG